MGELGALFNPGMRHEIEERESKANRREEEGNARDGDLRIDLLSGVAVINVPGKPAAEGEDGEPPASRTVGEKPAGGPRARPARAQARSRAAASRNAASKGAQHKSSDTKGEPPVGPRPSSKASRAGR